MSAYYASGGPAPAIEQPVPVLVAFASPAPQSRLTVLVRIFMVIPQLIVLYLLGIAAMVVTIIGWFGALFTGRLPVFAADFLTGYLRWLTRVYGYAILLTDVYPPFSLDDADYPVRVSVTPGQLNRLAVLFRLFLLIPCWLVTAIAIDGAFTIFQFVSWLIVLISGRMPDAIHQALSAVLRYYVRTLGFALMLTSAYPAGLFGDPEVPGPWSPAWPPAAAGPYGQPQPGYGTPQPGYGAPPGYGDPQGYGGQPGYGDPQAPAGYGSQPEYGAPQPEYGAPQAGYGTAQAGYGTAQAGYGAPQPGYGAAQAGYGAGGGDLAWRIVLSGAARKLVVVFIVLGALIGVGGGAIDAAVIGNTVSAAAAAVAVSTDVVPVGDAINNYAANVQACNNNLGCVRSLDSKVAGTLDTFAAQLRAIHMPSRAVAANDALATAVSVTAAKFALLSRATTVSQYNSEFTAAGLQQSIDQINQAYSNLGTALTS